MDNICIKHSDESTPEEIIYDLMKIEKNVYSPEYCGEFESMHRRFLKYRDMFVLAYDENEIIGYLCFFPVSDKLYNELMSEECFHDDDISPNDVRRELTNSHIYLLSIALYKKYQGKGIGKKMTDAFLKKIRGQNVIDVVASAVTPQGEALLKKYGFELIGDYSESEHYKLFWLEGEKI